MLHPVGLVTHALTEYRRNWIAGPWSQNSWKMWGWNGTYWGCAACWSRPQRL